MSIVGRKESLKMINDTDKQYLLNLTPDDIDSKLMMNLFGHTSKKVDGKVVIKKPRFNTTDELTLNAGEYINKEKVKTTVGKFIFNKFIVEVKFKDVLGYINYPITKSSIGRMENELAKALLTDRITQEDMSDYLNRIQWLGLRFTSVLCGSLSPKTIKAHPAVIQEREKLLKENRESIDNGDIHTIVEIEKKLLKKASEVLMGDSGMNLYHSGATGSFENNYKNMSVIKGPIYDPVNDKFDIIDKNLNEGIRKQDLTPYANSVVTGAYPKAVGTQVAGYLSKQITAAMQSVILDKAGSDCGTKGYITITLSDKLKNDFIYRYIITGKTLLILTEDNIDKYYGKEVQVRSPLYCINSKICNKCAGDMYYKLGLTNLGLTSVRVSSALLNLSMKKFHDSTVKTYPVDIRKLII